MNHRISLQLLVFTIIPKNLLSYIFGLLASLKLHPRIQKVVNHNFVRIFGLRIDEAEHPTEDYDSLELLFSRRLKKNMRSFTPPICSPCDGTLTYSQPITNDTLIQAKGLHYCPRELIFGKGEKDSAPDLTWASTIYLAPHNYHRVHMPFTGTVETITHIPGSLWPVNQTFANAMPNLFCENDRLVFCLKKENSGLPTSLW